MKSVDEHLADVLRLVAPLPAIEVEIVDAHGTVLAEDVAAEHAQPPFDNSAMDGYAVVAADLAGASAESPVVLPVVGEVAAGDGRMLAILPGMCARILTGAPIPAGVDAVVPVEWTDGGAAKVAITRAPAAGNAIRRAGEDVAAGATVLRGGTRLGARQIGLLAGIGRRTALVHPRPRVAVVSTGSELVEPGTPLGPGQIWDSNSYLLAGAATEAGGLAFRQGFAADDPAEVLAVLEDLQIRADLIVTSGGVSMGGDRDVVKAALAGLGTVAFDKVAMQPGMPQGAGTVGDDAVPILTLPGNPVSAYISFLLFAVPAMRAMQGLRPEPPATVPARLTAPLRSPAGKRSYGRARLVPVAAGQYEVTPVRGQGSHQLASLVGADAVVVVAEDVTQLAPGEKVEVIRLP